MIESVNKAHPDQFVNCFIAEQNLAGVSTGVGKRGRIPFCATFATFFTRAADQIRMGAISQANVKFVGSHCGVSIGDDGPSQMGLEDIALFRAVPGTTVLYPSDAVSCEKATELAANTHGMFFIRTNRPATTVYYDNNTKFEVGKSKVLKKSDNDKITVVGGGVTLDEGKLSPIDLLAMKAAEILAADKINIRVVDIFSVKPIDKETLVKAAKETNNLVLTVEDHYMEGGIHGK
jgi:transketolase